MIAIAIFGVAALTTSQSAATRTMVPLGLALGIGAGYMIAMWTAVVRRPLPPGERHADRGGRGRLHGHDDARQARDRPLLPAPAPGRLDLDGARRDRDRGGLPLDGRGGARVAGGDAKGQELTVIGAAFLGVGSMVGAGIFALLGQAGAVAGPATWLSFLLAGLIASLLGYMVVKLGVRYPSRGGFVSYLVEAFGNGRLVGITSWLLFFVILIVTVDGRGLVRRLRELALLRRRRGVLLGQHPRLGRRRRHGGRQPARCRFGRKTQSLIVWVLLGVFAVFAVVTLAQLDPSLLAPSGYPSVTKIIACVALTFFAYLGFSVITFAAGDLPNPARTLPRAMTLALGDHVAVYVAVSLGVFGTLTVDEVIEHGDTALAEAARPALGTPDSRSWRSPLCSRPPPRSTRTSSPRAASRRLSPS